MEEDRSRNTFLGYQTLAPGGQTDHDNTYSGVIDLHAFPIGFLIGDHCGGRVGRVGFLAVIEQLGRRSLYRSSRLRMNEGDEGASNPPARIRPAMV